MFMNAHVNIWIMRQADVRCIRNVHAGNALPRLTSAGEMAEKSIRALLFGAIRSPLHAKRQSRLSGCTAEWKQSESGWLLKVIEKFLKHPVIMV